MKRICMIIPSFTAKGGIASVASGYRGSELEQRYRIHYIETYCDGGKIAKLWKAIAAYGAFFRELLFFKPDLIHIHSAFGASFYRKAPFIVLGAALGIPVVNHIHGSVLEAFYEKKSDRAKSMIRSLYGKCSRVIVLSEQWKNRFSEMISHDKMEVVVNYSVCREADAEDSRSGSKMVLFLGFLSQAKGCFDIPQIAAAVKEKTDVTFVLAGAGTDVDVRAIRQMVQKTRTEDCILLPGWVRGAEKEKLLEKASVFFLPSYTEGMPMSILEAMGYGLPVVSTRVGGIPQLVKHEENGYLCDPGNIPELADALVRILTDSQRQKEMGQESLRIARNHYSLQAHCSHLMRIYEECWNH